MERRSGKHPRLRGEDEPFCLPQSLALETPPLTRGRLGEELLHDPIDGNTPAYAGKTASSRSSCWPQRKHPRLRGEDRRTRNLLFRLLETPPLTRGRLDRSPCIGFSPEKHPRLRGEDLKYIRSVRETGETPPLTRGRRDRKPGSDRKEGNTPAYAGKT